MYKTFVTKFSMFSAPLSFLFRKTLNPVHVRARILKVAHYCGRPTSKMSGDVSIAVEPHLSTLVDEKVTVAVSGLAPNSKITVRSSILERRYLFEGVARFVADKDGLVDVSVQESLGGSYTGVEPMGLFWSIRAAPDQKPGTRFVKQDVSKPMQFNLAVFDGHHTDCASLGDTQPLAVATVQKWYMRESDVERIKVHSGKIRGVLFKPKGPGPFPGIIDMFGGAGGNFEFRAALLASRGYAAYALPYFSYEDVPNTMKHIHMEYFEEATLWLASQPYVSPNGLGIVGASLGGSIALQMTSTGRLPQIKAVVAICSIPMFFTNVYYGGEQLHCSFYKGYENSQIVDGWYVTRVLLEHVKDMPDDKLIDFQNFNGHFLFLVGEDDKNLPSDVGTARAIQKLQTYGKTNYELVSYPEAGHLLEPPYHPVSIGGIYNGTMGILIHFGGHLKAHADACEDSWAKTLSFLHQHLMEEKGSISDKPTIQQKARDSLPTSAL